MPPLQKDDKTRTDVMVVEEDGYAYWSSYKTGFSARYSCLEVQTRITEANEVGGVNKGHVVYAGNRAESSVEVNRSKTERDRRRLVLGGGGGGGGAGVRTIFGDYIVFEVAWLLSSSTCASDLTASKRHSIEGPVRTLVYISGSRESLTEMKVSRASSSYR